MRFARLLGVTFVLALIWNCGGSSSSDSPGPTDASTNVPDTSMSATDASSATDAGVADVVSSPDASDGATCNAGAACTTNPDPTCHTGVISCNGSSATCVDGPPRSDGTTCSAGLCTRGTCLGETTISAADVDLSADSLTSGRTCAESPAFAVTALTTTTATLAKPPNSSGSVGSDCLAPGDEVMLIDQQGATDATTNVGNWELLEVASVSGTTVTFKTAKTKSYGATAGTDTAADGGALDQKVTLLRVPQFGALKIDAGRKVTTSAWNGTSGGIVALRAAKLTVNGTITAAALGYRSGRWSRDDSSCSDSVATESGESISGPAAVTTARNTGGPGGLGGGSSISFNGNTPICAGAAHSAAGEAGKNGNGRTLGDPGAAYGANDATKLTMGSGASGNLTCESNFAGPQLVFIAGFEHLAGGIVTIFADRVDVGASGAISANALEASRDVSASGGYVYLKGTTLNVGTDQVTATGGTGTSTNGPSAGQTVKSSDGYVVLDGTTFTGTTKPVANQL